MGILGLLRLPFRVVHAPVSIMLIVLGFRRRRQFTLPVAGLDEAKAQSIYFALKRAAITPEQEAVGLEWLAGLQIVQVASTRILSELDTIEENLNFWTRRLDGGRHFWFTLFCHGPVAFVRRLSHMLGGEPADENTVSDVELVEKRVLIFRLLRGELCEAAAAVQRAGALLYLQHSPTEEESAISTAAMNEALFIRAREAVEASMNDVARAFSGLESGVRATLHAQQGPQGPAAGDRTMLAQALGRVLGMTPLRRIWTQPEEVQAVDSEEQQVEEEEEAPLVGGGGEQVVAAADGDGPATVEESTLEDVVDASAAGNALFLGQAHVAAQRFVGFTPTLRTGTTVHDALAEARHAAVVIRRTPAHARLVRLPHWVLMPSQAQRHWVRYAVIGVAVGYGTLFLVRHSRIAGSRDLDNWAKAAVDAVKAAWADHVVGPLERVRGELFNTFRRRPAIVTMQEYEADRDSLQRMLTDFEAEFIKKRGKAAATVTLPSSSEGVSSSSGNATAVDEVQLLRGMDLMMRSYESELKRPVRGFVSGDLLRSLLIQVQKLKVDTESAMLEIDQILRANELSVSLVAAVPAFLIAGAGLYSLGRAMTPAPPDPRREALPARVAMLEVERSLEVLANTEQAASDAADAGVRADVARREQESAEAAGVFIFRLAVAYNEADELFRRHRGIFRSAGDAEWANLRGDLLELAAPAPAAQKLRTAARMMRVYAIYQQF